jgi:hypothetical protein
MPLTMYCCSGSTPRWPSYLMGSDLSNGAVAAAELTVGKPVIFRFADKRTGAYSIFA